MVALKATILSKIIFLMLVSRSGPNVASSFRLRYESARRQNQNRRFAGRFVHGFKRRDLRLAFEHAHLESAAERNSRHAQNPGSPPGRERQSGSAPNDVSRP